MRYTLTATILALALHAAPLRAEETPPPGPPWVFDFVSAQETALREGKAIFLYLTKTH